MTETVSGLAMETDEEQWRVVLSRDSSFDGRLFYGVTSTGIYCRPSCPSRRPRLENARFFASAEEAESAGFRECRRCKPKSIAASAELVKRVTGYIDAHPDERITLEDLASHAGLSPFHLQRSFKRATGVTPRAYAEQTRMKRLSNKLPRASTVTEAIYDAGFGASSRAYENTARETNLKPGDLRRKGAGLDIRYAIAPSEFGQLLVAATAKGVCAVRLGDTAEELEAGFERDFERASRTRDDAALCKVVQQILESVHLPGPHPEIPTDVRATAFQRQVWDYLRQIPRGETRSYSRVAADLGSPKAVRAVARACATNEVALVTPCHRVVGANGDLTGFRWGVERKRKLLENERSASS